MTSFFANNSLMNYHFFRLWCQGKVDLISFKIAAIEKIFSDAFCSLTAACVSFISTFPPSLRRKMVWFMCPFVWSRMSLHWKNSEKVKTVVKLRVFLHEDAFVLFSIFSNTSRVRRPRLSLLPLLLELFTLMALMSTFNCSLPNF